MLYVQGTNGALGHQWGAVGVPLDTGKTPHKDFKA